MIMIMIMIMIMSGEISSPVSDICKHLLKKGSFWKIIKMQG